MDRIKFVTGNKSKVEEAAHVLKKYGIDVKQLDLNYPEKN